MKLRSVLITLGGVAVVAVLLLSLRLAGSPWEARARSMDFRRVNDLENIEQAVELAFEESGKLPDRLDQLKLYSANADATRDPVTNLPYTYRVLGEREFELGATFETQAPALQPWESARSSFRGHPKGPMTVRFAPKQASGRPSPTDWVAKP